MHNTNNRLYLGDYEATVLIEKYGSPLFVYEENVIRQRCRQLKNIAKNNNVRVYYSCKANSNISILKIIRDEGLFVDAMSPGEIYLEKLAGFTSDQILYVSNNLTKDEIKYGVDEGILMSMDSISQLEYYGQVNPGGEVMVRINPGIAAGHHVKVMTGYKSKFGVVIAEVDTIKNVDDKYNLKIVGLNIHIGSLFLNDDEYIEAAQKLLEVSDLFKDIKYIDFGGGFGIPYRKADETRLNLETFANRFDKLLTDWHNQNEKDDVIFFIEPGRYPVAESGTLITTVTSVKNNYGTEYIGTNIGFNILIRPAMYDAYHEILVCNNVEDENKNVVTVCGNICESGDIFAKDRELPEINLGDTLAILDAGAYGFSMSSNYNSRLRPAEIMIERDGGIKIIRERETFDILALNQCF
jgi:diaminopimelate decarboxylase